MTRAPLALEVRTHRRRGPRIEPAGRVFGADRLRIATPADSLEPLLNLPNHGELMANDQDLMIYTAVYASVADALSDLDAIEELHKDELIGKYDAAVIDKKDGKPQIAKRKDRPLIQIVPEAFGYGKLPRKELKEAAAELTSDQAGLIVVGEPTIEKGVDKAIKGASKVVKRALDASADEIANELQEALKS